MKESVPEVTDTYEGITCKQRFVKIGDWLHSTRIPYSGSPSLVQRVVTIKVYKVQNFINFVT
jgi:hypothetical protein